MHKGINYFLICCISICFIYCNKCHEKQIGYYNLSPQDLQIIPYNGNEVIKFQNLSGDSIHFSVGSRVSNMSKKYQVHQDETTCNYYMLATNNMVITSDSNSFQFSILLSTFPSPYISGCYKAITFGSMIHGPSNETSSQSTVIFEPDTIISYDYYWPYGDLIFHKSLTLGTKSFTDVYEIELILQAATINKWVNKLYYNIDQGIVGFYTNQNELWYLGKQLK